MAFGAAERTKLLALSGLATAEDVAQCRAIGCSGVLVGEALMRAVDPGRGWGWGGWGGGGGGWGVGCGGRSGWGCQPQKERGTKGQRGECPECEVLPSCR